MENTQNIEAKIDFENLDNIPLEEIVEARNALANEYITLREEIERKNFLSIFNRRRLYAREFKLRKYLARLDSWLKEVN